MRKDNARFDLQWCVTLNGTTEMKSWRSAGGFVARRGGLSIIYLLGTEKGAARGPTKRARKISYFAFRLLCEQFRDVDVRQHT